MKIAVISDIHGNLPALEAVLRDAEKRGIAEFIFAGDYCLSGPYPDACISAVRQVKNKHAIRGNEERYLENLIGKDQLNWTDGQMQISYWCFRNITPENLHYLTELPHTLDFSIGDARIHLAHSLENWISDCEFRLFGPAVIAKQFADIQLLPDTLSGHICTLLDRDPAFQDALSGLEEGIYLFGHSHVQWSYKASGRNVYLVNPGSCGLPLDGIIDSVPYAVLTIRENGEMEIENVRIPFDKQQYTDQLKTTTQFTEANVWSRVILRELITAREHLTFFLEYAEQYARKINDPRRPYSVETWENAYREWEQTLPQKT